MDLIQKGDIFTDGAHLIIYYGDSNERVNSKYYTLLGQLDDVNFLLKTFLQQQQNNINFRVVCQSSLLDNRNASITFNNPNYYIFNKDSLDFDDIPNLYFEKNREPLYPYCKINENKRYEIKCSFSKNEIKNNYFKYGDSLPIFEVIPGCKDIVQNGLYFHFEYEIPHCFQQVNQKCLICNNMKMYELSDDNRECKFSSFFYYMCIGLPLLNIFLIIHFICILVQKCDISVQIFVFSVVFLVCCFLALNIAFLSVYFVGNKPECEDIDKSSCSDFIPTDETMECRYNDKRERCEEVKKNNEDFITISKFSIVLLMALL